MPRSLAFLLILSCTILAVAAASTQCPGGDGNCDAINDSDATAAPDHPTFRYWVDYGTYIRNDSTQLVEDMWTALGGRCTGGPPKKPGQGPPELADLGVNNMDDWDIYVTACPQCMYSATHSLRPGQLVGSVLGSHAITAKTLLPRTLQALYGPHTAASIVPRTFLLPAQRAEWLEWIKAHPELDTGYWVLKNNEQRAAGIKLVSTPTAYAASFEGTEDHEPQQQQDQGQEQEQEQQQQQQEGTWKLVQQYITNPLLLDGRKFGLRVHVFIAPGLEPFRVYIHKRGFANLADTPYDNKRLAPHSFIARLIHQARRWLGLTAAATPSPSPSSSSPHLEPGHFTNQVLQTAGVNSWSFAQVKEAIGEQAWQVLWGRMTNTTAWIMAASLPAVRAYAHRANVPPRSAYELFGIDFLVDTDMHLWVTEVNPGPSMRVGSAADSTAFWSLMTATKVPTVRDMFGMMRLKERHWGQAQEPVVALDEVEAELQLRGDWLPLMHLFPHISTAPEVKGLPWVEADRELQDWLRDSTTYQQALQHWKP